MRTLVPQFSAMTVSGTLFSIASEMPSRLIPTGLPRLPSTNADIRWPKASVISLSPSASPTSRRLFCTYASANTERAAPIPMWLSGEERERRLGEALVRKGKSPVRSVLLDIMCVNKSRHRSPPQPVTVFCRPVCEGDFSAPLHRLPTRQPSTISGPLACDPGGLSRVRGTEHAGYVGGPQRNGRLHRWRVLGLFAKCQAD